MALRQEMTRYNHVAGLRIVGETEPQRQNRIEIADEKDQYRAANPAHDLLLSDNDRS